MSSTHLFRNILFKLWICFTTATIALAQQRPDSKAFIADELETLLVNTGGSGLANAGFAAAITPCTNYVDRTTGQNNNALGRQSAAQWIRTAFRKAPAFIVIGKFRVQTGSVERAPAEKDMFSTRYSLFSSCGLFERYLTNTPQTILPPPTSPPELEGSMRLLDTRQIALRILVPGYLTLSFSFLFSSLPKRRVRTFLHHSMKTDLNHKAVADLIALGAVISIKSCGGPFVSLRGGRVDATEAGSFGVCEPETDIDSTLSKFAAAGFSQADAIALTACGHSMGG